MTTVAAIPRGRACAAPAKSRWRWRELAALLVVAACGCQNLREANEDAIRTEATINRELGANAHVQYRTIFTPFGRQAVVAVKMESGQLDGGSRESDSVNEIVRRTFRSRVDKVDVLYRVDRL